MAKAFNGGWEAVLNQQPEKFIKVSSKFDSKHGRNLSFGAGERPLK
jgi:hypothetical protein